jgi:hypothetical protein
MDRLQACTVDNPIGGEPCQRLAQWECQMEPDGDPVFLCNFHAEPLMPLPGTVSIYPVG